RWRYAPSPVVAATRPAGSPGSGCAGFEDGAGAAQPVASAAAARAAPSRARIPSTTRVCPAAEADGKATARLSPDVVACGPQHLGSFVQPIGRDEDEVAVEARSHPHGHACGPQRR